MTPTQLFVLRTLDHVNQGRWKRPAALLRLIAYLAPDGQAVPLSRSQLARLQGRPDGSAEADRRVLHRLCDQHVLSCNPGRGRKADVWAINLNVEKWAHVPWLTSSAEAVRALRLAPVPTSRPIVPTFPWSQPFVVPTSLPQWVVEENLTWDNAFPSVGATERHVGTMVRPPYGFAANYWDKGERVGDSSPSLLGTTYPLSKGGSQRVERTREARALIQAVKSKTGVPFLEGPPADRLAARVDAHPDRLSEFLATVDRFPPGGAFNVIIDALEGDGAPAQSDPEVEKNVLIRKASALRGIGVRPDEAELRVVLDELRDIAPEWSEPWVHEFDEVGSAD